MEALEGPPDVRVSHALVSPPAEVPTVGLVGPGDPVSAVTAEVFVGRGQDGRPSAPRLHDETPVGIE